MFVYSKCNTICRKEAWPTAQIEGKVQRTLTKTRETLPSFVYSKICSKIYHCLGSFVGLLNYMKLAQLSSYLLDQSSRISEPPRPIISNIGTVTFDLATYLPQLLKPLKESQYTIKKLVIYNKAKGNEDSSWIQNGII